MGKNFSDRLKAEREAIQIAVQQTYTQFMMDMISLTLNDPEVMGKDTFGYERLLRVLHGVEANFDKYADALTKKANADYCREKLDENLARICGDKLIPFEKRYDWVVKINYGRQPL